MLTRALLAIFFGVSCAPASVTWSAYGATHWDARADASHAEHELVRHLVSDCGLPMKGVEQAIGAAEVHWVDAPWTGPDGEEWQGVTDGARIRVVRGNWAAYRHELTHLVGAVLYASPDKQHTHPCWWRTTP